MYAYPALQKLYMLFLETTLLLVKEFNNIKIIAFFQKNLVSLIKTTYQSQPKKLYHQTTTFPPNLFIFGKNHFQQQNPHQKLMKNKKSIQNNSNKKNPNLIH
jgi:hypothetical protein